VPFQLVPVSTKTFTQNPRTFKRLCVSGLADDALENAAEAKKLLQFGRHQTKTHEHDLQSVVRVTFNQFEFSTIIT
jgi:hypothetical protein